MRSPLSLIPVTIEIPKGAWPVRGHVTFEGEEPKPFWGWAELRTMVDAALGKQNAIKKTLTCTEVRIVSLVCEGLSNPEIARLLVMSPRTVQGHLYRIFKKLGVRNRSELVAEWLHRSTADDTVHTMCPKDESNGS